MPATKQQLSEIRVLDSRINCLVNERKEIKRAIAYMQRKMMRSSNSPQMKYIKKWNLLLKKIDEDQAEFEAARQEIIDQIDSLQDSRHSLLLYKRYVDLKPFRRIAEEMNYSEDYLVHLLNDAIKAFEQAGESGTCTPLEE